MRQQIADTSLHKVAAFCVGAAADSLAGVRAAQDHRHPCSGKIQGVKFHAELSVPPEGSRLGTAIKGSCTLVYHQLAAASRNMLVRLHQLRAGWRQRGRPYGAGI